MFQVDKLEQSESVRSEEEQKAEEAPIVFGKSLCTATDYDAYS